MGPIQAKSRQLSALNPLPLSLLPQDGLRFEEPLPVAWLTPILDLVKVEGFGLRPRGEGALELTVTPLGDVDAKPPVQLSATIRVEVDTSCVRCQEDLHLPLSTDFELTMFAAGSLPDPAAPAEDKSKSKSKGKGKSKAKDKAKKHKKGKKQADDPEAWTEAELLGADALGQAEYEDETLNLPAALEEFFLLALNEHPSCPDAQACDARTAALLAAVNAEADNDADFKVDARWAGLERYRAATEPGDPD